jgi:hypothetical protein
MADIHAAFVFFSNGTSLMDRQSFLSFCTDCDLQGDQLVGNDIEQVFSKVVPKDSITKKINFNQFVLALQQLADKRTCSLSFLASLIAEARERAQVSKKLHPVPPSEPRSSASSPASTKYCSAMSTPRSSVSSGSEVTMSRADFDSICEQLRTNQLLGPPAVHALEEAAGLSKHGARFSVGNKAKALRAKMVDVRELDSESLIQKLEELHETMMQKDNTIGLLRKEVSGLRSEQTSLSPTTSSRRCSSASNGPATSNISVKLTQRRISCSSRSRRLSTQLQRNPVGLLHEAYTSISNGPNGVEMKTFVQLCVDAHLVDKAFTSKDAQRVFGEVANKDEYGYFGISFAQFKSALELVAEHKSIDVTEVSDAVCSVGEEQHQMVHWVNK